MVKFAELHLSENCSLQLIAKEMNMNANYLGQLFKREFAPASIGKHLACWIKKVLKSSAAQPL